MECIIGYGVHHAGLGCSYWLRMTDPWWWDYIVWNGSLLFT